MLQKCVGESANMQHTGLCGIDRISLAISFIGMNGVEET